jgi:hypothetical protein
MSDQRRAQLISDLRTAAAQIAAAGHNGWGNLCTAAADELECVPEVWSVVHKLDGDITGVYATEDAAQRACRGWERVEKQPLAGVK